MIAVYYEDLVVNPRDQLQIILEFLEVDWDEAVLDFAQHARQRMSLRTPSYQQVTQPIYTHARHRWHRYRKNIDPVIGHLKPYIDEFSYDDRLT